MTSAELPNASPASASASAPTFQLTPPEVITPVPMEASRTAVPLKPGNGQRGRRPGQPFHRSLMTEDVHSAGFKAKLDSAFALGHRGVAAANLMQGRFLQHNFIGADDTPAYKAIAEIRGQLDKLNPGNDGDLLSPNKLLGIIPSGNKLQAYFRRFESAGEQLQKSMAQLYAARDDVQRDIADIETTRGKLWEAMQQLAAAAHFATSLDAKLADRVSALEPSTRSAQALRQGAVLPARTCRTSRPSRPCA
jgi:hypothetical protein